MPQPGPAVAGLPARLNARGIALAGLVLAVSLPIAALPLVWAAAYVGGLALTLVILARPVVALYLLVFSVPYESLRQVEVGGASLGSTEALVALLALGWALRVATDREREPLRARLTPPIVLMLVAIGVATLRAVNLPLAVKEGVRWFEVLIVYLVATDLVRTSRQRAVLLALLVLAAVSEALLGLVQFFFRLGPDSFRTGGFLRAYGTFGQPNPYAGYLGMVLPLALVLTVAGLANRDARRSVPFWLLLGATGVIGAAFGASLSRGAWMGFAFAFAIVGSVASRRAFLGVVACLLVGAFVLTLGALEVLPAQIAERLTQIVSYFGIFDVRRVEVTPANWAVVERMAVWQAAWGMFEAHPFFGVGPGNYAIAYEDFAMPGWELAMGHAHNIYLNFLAETGAVGLASFIVFLLSALAAVWQSYRLLRRAEVAWWERVISLGVLGVLAQFALHSLFDNLLVHGLNVQLAILLALSTWPANGDGKAVASCWS